MAYFHDLYIEFQGGDAKEVAAKIYGKGGAPKAPAAPPKAAPPPPPPPPAGAKPKGAAPPPTSNLFAEINKGSAVTAGTDLFLVR